MNAIFIGLLAGTYINNPGFRKMVDNTVKSTVKQGVDFLNKRPVDVPMQEIQEDGEEGN